MKYQGDILNFYDFIQVFVLTTNHHIKVNRKAMIEKLIQSHPTSHSAEKQNKINSYLSYVPLTQSLSNELPTNMPFLHRSRLVKITGGKK